MNFFIALSLLVWFPFLVAEPRIGPGLCLQLGHADDRDKETSKLIPEDGKAV
jgi:hypothetical protein